MERRGRSERTRPQRLARRRADSQGFDRGGGRRSFFRSRYAKIFYVVGLVGMIGSLVPILLLGGGGHSSSSDPDAPPPVRVVDDPNRDIGVVEGTPQFEAPPELTLDTSLEYEAVLELEDGRIVRVELFDDEAPLHVNNFVFLAREGFYDGLTFHRIVADFVVQAGDPTATGTGGAGYTLPDEVVRDDHRDLLSLDQTGVISMARGGLGASSSQFFITLSPSGFLDAQRFTAFGRVTEGLDLLQAFDVRDPSALPTPPAGPRIVSITIIER